MNLASFLNQIDAMAAQYSAAQLISFIHDSGRILPESEREDFLKRLRAVGQNDADGTRCQSRGNHEDNKLT